MDNASIHHVCEVEDLIVMVLDLPIPYLLIHQVYCLLKESIAKHNEREPSILSGVLCSPSATSNAVWDGLSWKLLWPHLHLKMWIHLNTTNLNWIHHNNYNIASCWCFYYYYYSLANNCQCCVVVNKEKVTGYFQGNLSNCHQISSPILQESP